MNIELPETTAQAGAMLRRLLELPLADGIAYATQTDGETFLPPAHMSNREATWWALCDAAFEKYRNAASLPGCRIALALERALVARERAPDITDLDDVLERTEGKLCPRWPSGIAKLNSACGGAYGTEVIAGEPGAGKSLLALDQAVQAAANGWRVIYYDTELSIPNLRMRLNAVKYNRPNDYFMAIEGPERMMHLASLDTLRGGFVGMCEFITERIMPSDKRVLIVLDHVHDVVRGLVRGSQVANQFFRTLEAIGDAAKTSRRETEGAVGWILVAELNQKGGVRGGQLDYAADMVIALADDKDAQDVSDVRVAKGREGGGGGYGKHYRDWKRGRLVSTMDHEAGQERVAEMLEEKERMAREYESWDQ